jgi:hypothetical protein
MSRFSSLDSKDGHDFGQMDQGREVFKQTFDDDLSVQYFSKDPETIFVEKVGEAEFDL